MIRICLPDLAGRIDMNTVTAVDATFTGGKQADLLLSIRERSDGNRRGREHLVYMLVEHKSYHDPLVAVQLYRYLGAIWQRQWINVESKVRGPLPVIHPVVFYHGVVPWTTPLTLTGLHVSEDRDHVPDDTPFTTDLVYRLVDLSMIEPERLRIATRTLAFLITLRHVFRRLEQPSARHLVETLGTLPIGVETRIRLFEYLLFNMPDENTGLLVTELEEREYTMEGGATIMTVAQELRRQGEEKGRKEGLKDGREEARTEVARRMLAKGLSTDLITETTGLTAEQVAALRNGENKKGSSPG